MVDRISVIVPVYNVADDLSRCLDSILAQTYSNIEIIAVDDGSSDNSGDILDQYADKHQNICVIHKENGGVTSARLRGIKEATGEWIGFVDGDDEIEPNMYERLLNNAKKFDAQISHCGYQMHFVDGRVHYFHNSGLLVKQDQTTALHELLSGSMVEPGLWNKLFQKNLFINLEVDTSIRINEDLLMNFYLFSRADTAVFEDWCPYHYMVRDNSVSRAKLNEYKIYDPIRVKEIIRQAAIKDVQNEAQRAYINTCINTYHVLLGAGKEYRADRQKVRSYLKHEKKNFFMLGKKRALMAQLIIKVPIVYKSIYSFYSRFLQKTVYS